MIALKNDNLWFLLHRHALQEKSKEIDEDEPSLLMETMCFKIEKAGCPSL